jgi:hypothetical protein
MGPNQPLINAIAGRHQTISVSYESPHPLTAKKEKGAILYQNQETGQNVQETAKSA